MKLKIGLAQNILYQFNIFCIGTKTNCTKVQIELQHVHSHTMYQPDFSTCRLPLDANYSVHVHVALRKSV